MILSIKNLTGGYIRGHDVLHDLSFEVAEGDCVGVIGLNGSGKTTFARALMNNLPCRTGEIRFDGADVSLLPTRALSTLGMSLFMQNGAVFDELLVRENLAICAGARVSNPPNTLPHRLTTRADRLSGGERHQLALAMCLNKRPRLLILDEPSSGLSPAAVNHMYQTLADLRDNERLTIILIEQNIARAVEFCHSVNMLKDGKFVFRSDNKDLNEIERMMFEK